MACSAEEKQLPVQITITNKQTIKSEVKNEEGEATTTYHTHRRVSKHWTRMIHRRERDVGAIRRHHLHNLRKT